MTAKELRKRYIDFFKSPPRDHNEIKPAPLVLGDDPSTLFTSAGMQPLTPYLLGEKHPKGKRLVNSQPSIRSSDIEEVGDNRHTTFFEMLGNWSLGDYFKGEQLSWVWEFFTKKLKLDPKKLYVTVYGGDEKFSVGRDIESVNIWKDIYKKEGIKAGVIENAKKNGMQGGRIFYYPDNWWSMTGGPSKMNVGHIGGPDSEVFYEFTNVEHNPKYGRVCHPNDDCGRFLEIGNSVFIQYKKVSDTNLEELKQKNVDFGGGFERILAAVNDTPDIFKTDLFLPTISNLEGFTNKKYGTSEETDKSFRIIADHLRAALYILAEGVKPSNKLHGYVLRRLIRRSVFRLKLLGFDISKGAISTLARSYINDFEIIKNNWPKIKDEINIEAVKFNKALKRGMKKLNLLIEREKITGKTAFDLYQTEGFPLELTLEILEENGIKFTTQDKKEFEKEFEKHKNKSRSTSAGVFKGGLADHSPDVIRYHTAAHLLLMALRKVLGDEVIQKGQNITKDRVRFDFPYPRKLTDEEIKKVEDKINKIVKKDLAVNFKVMPKNEALKTGAIHAFTERYADTVKVYYVGDSLEKAVSKEFCGGPHVDKTGKIGRVRIKKQDKIGSNLMRVYLTAKDG